MLNQFWLLHKLSIPWTKQNPKEKHYKHDKKLKTNFPITFIAVYFTQLTQKNNYFQNHPFQQLTFPKIIFKTIWNILSFIHCLFSTGHIKLKIIFKIFHFITTCDTILATILGLSHYIFFFFYFNFVIFSRRQFLCCTIIPKKNVGRMPMLW